MFNKKARPYAWTDLTLEYPCWYMQSVLLQGYMYITQAHVCFYAYLPKKSVSILIPRSKIGYSSLHRTSSPSLATLPKEESRTSSLIDIGLP